MCLCIVAKSESHKQRPKSRHNDNSDIQRAREKIERRKKMSMVFFFGWWRFLYTGYKRQCTICDFVFVYCPLSHHLLLILLLKWSAIDSSIWIYVFMSFIINDSLCATYVNVCAQLFAWGAELAFGTAIQLNPITMCLFSHFSHLFLFANEQNTFRSV